MLAALTKFLIGITIYYIQIKIKTTPAYFSIANTKTVSEYNHMFRDVVPKAEYSSQQNSIKELVKKALVNKTS